MRVFGGVLLLIAGIALAAEWGNFRGLLKTPTDFSRAAGVIERSAVHGHRGKTHQRRYGYDIAYRYTVAGRSYVSTGVSFGRRETRDRTFVEGYVRRYPARRAVTVWYDPRDPGFTVLEPATKGGTWMSLAVTGLLFLGALALLFWPRRR